MGAGMTIVFIPLTQGKVATINFEDFESIRGQKWCAQRRGRRWYAKREERGKTIYLHQQIVGTGPGDVDHKDGDGLNNCKENLHRVSRAQNLRGFNYPRSNNTSGVRGVSWCKPVRKWRARIECNGKEFNLGYFENLTDAVNARKLKAKELNYYE